MGTQPADAPDFVQTPGCMHLVGRSPACEALNAAMNDAIWREHTLPLTLLIAAGYLGIPVVAIAGRTRAAD